ncbi:MAG: GNAT family N-acetyltransferase [Clostridia bacterium]|nr:GNAT family N-acetyltransferase [Clostridia bacterium]
MNGKVIAFSEACIKTALDLPAVQPRQWLLIAGIAVDEKVRRSGAGQALLDSLKQWWAEHGIAEIELKVYTFNESAIRFYEKNGFKELSKNLSLEVETAR